MDRNSLVCVLFGLALTVISALAIAVGGVELLNLRSWLDVEGIGWLLVGEGVVYLLGSTVSVGLCFARSDPPLARLLSDIGEFLFLLSGLVLVLWVLWRTGQQPAQSVMSWKFLLTLAVVAILIYGLRDDLNTLRRSWRKWQRNRR